MKTVQLALKFGINMVGTLTLVLAERVSNRKESLHKTPDETASQSSNAAVRAPAEVCETASLWRSFWVLRSCVEGYGMSYANKGWIAGYRFMIRKNEDSNEIEKDRWWFVWYWIYTEEDAYKFYSMLDESVKWSSEEL